jgi:hypothetical protein
MATGKLRVYLTIDTETSLGGAWRNPEYRAVPLDQLVFGKYGSRFYGIPLMMDILEEYGFRATFFTEVFCSYLLGDGEVGKVFEYILRRGHDAQLHLHPIYRFYRDRAAGLPHREVDFICQLDPERQHELIAEGVSLFRRFSGQSPRAYRAGCYGASEVTLQALRANGVQIDSSYNLACMAPGGFQAPSLNAPMVMEGVYEFPVTVFRVSGSTGYKPLEVSAVSVREIVATLLSLWETGVRDAVLVLHSFSLLKNLGLRCDHYRPDNIVIQRLRALCKALSGLSEKLEVESLGNVDLATVPAGQPQAIPSAGWVQPAIRKLVQGVNRLPWL